MWTNIIDNVIDALGREDVITLRTRAQRIQSWSRIKNNDPGFPEDVLGPLSDAFATTKPSGKGTSLGLDITYGGGV